MLQVYDRVLTSRSVPTLIALTLLVIGLYVFMAILEFVRARVPVRVGRRLDEQLSGRVLIPLLPRHCAVHRMWDLSRFETWTP